MVLVNSSIIDGCFYDVYNRYFTVTTTPDGKKQFVANVAIGSHSRACPIHSEFQIMVHVPLSRMKSTPLPFLNRFEKYMLSINQVVEVSFQLHPPFLVSLGYSHLYIDTYPLFSLASGEETLTHESISIESAERWFSRYGSTVACQEQSCITIWLRS